MKRTIILVMFIVICISCPLFAMDFIIGAKAGYFVWRPYFKDVDTAFFQGIESGEGILYGPVMSIVFTPDISFSLAGLYGTQSAHWNFNNKYISNENRYQSSTCSIDSTRTDIDSALSYRLNRNFKLFAGYKYQSSRYNTYIAGAVFHKRFR